MTDWVGNFTTDVALEDTKADDAKTGDFDALLLHGGVTNPGMVRCGADGFTHRRPAWISRRLRPVRMRLTASYQIASAFRTEVSNWRCPSARSSD